MKSLFTGILVVLLSCFMVEQAFSYEIIEDSLTITNEVPKKPDASAVLELSSTTKGFLGVRMTLLQRDAVASPAVGLVIYNLDSLQFESFNGVSWNPVGGVGTSSIINQVAHGRTVGPSVIPVYDNGGIWADAQADSNLTIATHVIVEVIDVDNFILAKVGKFTVPGHGLMIGFNYFTDASTAGGLTITEPILYSNPVIRVRDANTIEVSNYRASIKIPPVSPGSVVSVFGRGGAVTAQSGDYAWGQIDKSTSSIADIATKDINLLTGTLLDSQLVAGNVSQFESSIDHDALLNFEVSEHIDWTAPGAGAIDPSNYIDTNTVLSDAQIKTQYENNANTNEFSDLEQVKLTGIEVAATRDQTAPEIEALINHDNLAGYVPNEHVDHTSVSIATGLGLAGGGDLTSTRTLSVVESQLDITNMIGYSASTHIDHSLVSIDTSDANDGLIGGGDLTATRTLSVDVTSLSLDGVISGNEEIMFFDIGTNKLVKATMDDLKSFATGGVAPLTFQGTWDAATNTPNLVSSSGTEGQFYVVSVSGSTNLDGITTWNIGDQAIFQGGVWQRIPGSPLTVTTVFGRVGAILALANDYTWAQINKATSNISDITSRSHTDLQDIGTNTHTQIDTHISDGSLHRIINDAGTSALELWSANKIDSDLSGKANSSHLHSLVTDVVGILPLANGGTGSATQNFVDLTTAQSVYGAKTLVDALTLQSDLATLGLIDGRDVAVDGIKLDGVEALADVTDFANVSAAGALMFLSDFLDEDNMVSDSPIHVASQQSIKAYVDNEISGVPTAPILTVHSRVGAVVSANGDYTASQITNVAAGNLASVEVQSALNELQSDIDSRELTIVGAATTINTVDLTVDRALISDGSGKVAVSAVTAAELLNLSGLSSNIQTQLDTKIETASNLGGGGSVGIFKQEVGVDLEFKGINAGSNKISIINDTANDEVDIDVVEANLDHDSLAGYIANEHINHFSTSIVGQQGLSGGGNITTNRTLVLDFSNLATQVVADSDLFAFYDGVNHRKATRDSINNNLVRVSATDTVAGDLSDKLVSANGIALSVTNLGANEVMNILPDYGLSASTIAEGNHTHDRDTLDLSNGIIDLLTLGGVDHAVSGIIPITFAAVETADINYFFFDAANSEVDILIGGRYKITYNANAYCVTGTPNREIDTRVQRAVGLAAFADLLRSEVTTTCDNTSGGASTFPRARNHHTSTFTIVLNVMDRVRLIGERQGGTGAFQYVNPNLLIEYLGP